MSEFEFVCVFALGVVCGIAIDILREIFEGRER